MRRSPLSHPLAVLRTTIGLTQKELGALVGRAARTIQSIELRKLPLSEGLALRLAHETGIDAAWLMEGDPATPPRPGPSVFGLQHLPAPPAFTRKQYEEHRAWMELPIDTTTPVKILRTKGSVTGSEFKAIGQAHAVRRRTSQDRLLVKNFRHLLRATAPAEAGDLVRWKLRQMLKELAEEYSVQLPA